jgi:hypothetical protein
MIAERIQKLPHELEREISEYVFTQNCRLQYLLHKYPIKKMSRLFFGFNTSQLDRVYKDGCLSKIFMNLANPLGIVFMDAHAHPHVKNLFPMIQDPISNYRHHSCGHFAIRFCPVSGFRSYWETLDIKYQPSKPEYIRRIIKFCTDILEFPYIPFIGQSKNQALIEFCEKVVCDLISGVLIMRSRIRRDLGYTYDSSLSSLVQSK